MPTLQSILVPMDGSPPSLAALEHAVVLAHDYSARIEVLHVISSSDPVGPDARKEIASAMDVAVERAQSFLGARVAQRTAIGDPLREIIDAAQDVDMIVMGTHGRLGRLHALLGSVAEGVVRNAPCPVLTVRDPTGGYEGFAERRHRRPSLAEQAQVAAEAHGHRRP
jgi:nucleotide-binding universal stress UspA family protein